MTEYVFSQYYSRRINVKMYAIDACNYNCYYCYNEKHRNNQALDLNAAYYFLEQIFLKFKKRIIVELIGGEPTLHPGLIDFCKKAQTANFIEKILIYTNFSKDVDYYMRLIHIHKVHLDLSLHLGSVASNSKFMKKALWMKKSTKAIDKVTISILMHPNYIDYIKIIYATLTQANIDVDIVKIFNNMSKYQPTDQDIKYSSAMSLQIDQMISKSQQNKKRTIHIKTNDIDQHFTELEARNVCEKHRNLFLNWHCLAGMHAFYIHSNGQCYQCQQYYEMQMPHMFNVYDGNFHLNNSSIICKAHNCLYEQFVTKWKA